MWRVSGRFALITFMPAAAVLGLVAISGAWYQVQIADLFRDTASVAHLSPFTGVVSNLGILLWCVAGTVCALAWAMFKWAGDKGAARFFLSSALLSFLLMSDDLLQIHERLAFAYLGLREKHVLMLLALAMGGYLLIYRKRILAAPYGMLAISLALMGVSVVVDRLFPTQADVNLWYLLYEDGLKFVGIACWCAHFCRSSFSATQQLVVARTGSA